MTLDMTTTENPSQAIEAGHHPQVLEAGHQELTFLDLGEAEDLRRCETVIQEGQAAFIAVGQALLDIRDSRLYREAFGTFEEYLEKRWEGVSKSWAYRHISAAHIYKQIEAASPIGDSEEKIVPANESQMRPLSQLPEHQRTEAWAKAVEQSGGQPTAAVVQEVVTEMLPPKPEKADAAVAPLFAVEESAEGQKDNLQSGFVPPAPLSAQGDNAPVSAADALAALNTERDETVKGWSNAANDEQGGKEAEHDAKQEASAPDVDSAGEGGEDVQTGAEAGPVSEPLAGADAGRAAADADADRRERANPSKELAGDAAPVSQSAKDSAPKNLATASPSAPNTSAATAIAQPAGKVSHTILLTEQLDDWLWDQNLTPLEAVTELHRIKTAGLYLTPMAEQAATVLTHQYNERHPDAPISPYLQIEATLCVRVAATGVTVPEILDEEEYLHGSPAAETTPDTTEEN